MALPSIFATKFVAQGESEPKLELPESPTLKRMSEVVVPPMPPRLSTGVQGLDVCLAETDGSPPGLPQGTSVLLSGAPGGGKSTMALYMAGAVGAADSLVLYGEEREESLKRRWDRLGLAGGGDPWLAPLGDCEQALAHIRKVKPLLTVVDSVQTLSLAGRHRYDDQYEAVKLVIATALGGGGSVIFVSHVTKTGRDAAGSQGLPHAVDVVMHITTDAKKGKRFLEIRKNRVGRAGFRVPLVISNTGMACGTPASLDGPPKDGDPISDPGAAATKIEKAANAAYQLLRKGETLTAYDGDKADISNPAQWRAGLEMAAKHLLKEGHEVEEVKVGIRKAYRMVDPPDASKEPEPEQQLEDGPGIELYPIGGN